MPLYDYACSACGAETEIQHKMSDPAPTKCPVCGSDSLERLVSQSAFSLKGGGWYADGYSSKPDAPKKEGGEAKEGAAKKDAPAKTEAGGKDKGEAKPKSEKSKGGASDAA